MVMTQRLRLKPKAQEAQSTTPAPIRRLRVRTTPAENPVRVASKEADRAAEQAAKRRKIDEHLKLIATIEAGVDKLVTELAEHHNAVEAILREANIQTHSNGVHRVEIAEVYSRSSMEIDPKKFRAEVPDKVFWDSITVGVGKAREILGDKEVDRIGTLTPGKLTGHAFKIKRLERKT